MQRPLIATRKRGGGNSCVACQDSIEAGQKNDKYLMGAFEDGDFIIVGLDPDAAQ